MFHSSLFRLNLQCTIWFVCLTVLAALVFESRVCSGAEEKPVQNFEVSTDQKGEQLEGIDLALKYLKSRLELKVTQYDRENDLFPVLRSPFHVDWISVREDVEKYKELSGPATWVSSNEKYSVEAEYVEGTEEVVNLRLSAGKEKQIPVAKLNSQSRRNAIKLAGLKKDLIETAGMAAMYEEELRNQANKRRPAGVCVIPDIDPDYFAQMGLEISAASAKTLKEQVMPKLSPEIQRDVWDRAVPAFFDGSSLLVLEITGESICHLLHEPTRKVYENELNARRAAISQYEQVGAAERIHISLEQSRLGQPLVIMGEWSFIDNSIDTGLQYIYVIIKEMDSEKYVTRNNIYAISELELHAINAAQRRLLPTDTREAVDSAIKRLCSDNPELKSHVIAFETQLGKIADSKETLVEWKKVFPIYFRARLIELHRMQANIVNDILMPAESRKVKKEKIESLNSHINIDDFIRRIILLCYDSPYSFR